MMLGRQKSYINFRRLTRSYIRNESGATAIEYGLIAALIGAGIIVAVRSSGDSINTMFGKAEGELK